MQKSQRYGLLILALLCIAIIATVVIRSRTASQRINHDRPMPTEFTILKSASPDTTRYYKSKEKNIRSEEPSLKSSSNKKKSNKGSKRNNPSKEKPAQRKDWLDEP